MRLALVTALMGSAFGLAAQAQNVTTYHNSNTRSGVYTVPGLTDSTAGSMTIDETFAPTLSGNMYAQPLYYKAKGATSGEIIAVTESNYIYALDEGTGAVIWKTQPAQSVPLNDLECGNINPEGITGTPAIDAKAGVLYFGELDLVNSAPKQRIYAVSLATGSVVSGWPIDVESALSKLGITFTSNTQGERSAVLLFGGNLYVVYGGRYGDCGTYHGTVTQIDVKTPSITAAWQTSANAGGIWAQGGTAGDGKYVFATTGNTIGANSWSGGEAILRFTPGLAFNNSSKDYFAPSNWKTLDNEDADLGGTEALPLTIANGSGKPAQRVIALGKDGNAYLVNRTDLGGIGGQIATVAESTSQIITAPVVYTGANGSTVVAFQNSAAKACTGNALTAITVAPSGSNPISNLWCQPFNGRGSAMVTTTDGTSNPIVWVLGAEGDNLLHGFDGITGDPVYKGTFALSGLHHFQTLIAADGRLYVGADNRMYAFTFTQ
jgi:hypothetical protein